MTDIYGQCPCLFQTRSSVLLCAHRDIRPGRSGVGLSYSIDEGRTWKWGGSLYQAPDPSNRDCAYPSMTYLDTGEILCVYYTAFEGGQSDIEGVVLVEV